MEKIQYKSNTNIETQTGMLVTAQFIVSRCVYCKLRRDFGFFCSVNHFSEGGTVNANHNVTCSPSLAENDSRLLKNSEGNCDGEWIFCQRKEADVALFLQVTGIRKIRKTCKASSTSRLLPQNRTITKQRTLKHETNKTDRNPPITNHKPWPFELMPVNMYVLRGPLRWLTEQKKPKFLQSLQNTLHDTTNFTVKPKYTYSMVSPMISLNRQ